MGSMLLLFDIIERLQSPDKIGPDVRRISHLYNTCFYEKFTKMETAGHADTAISSNKSGMWTFLWGMYRR
jgi:hypothetical protein